LRFVEAIRRGQRSERDSRYQCYEEKVEVSFCLTQRKGGNDEGLLGKKLRGGRMKQPRWDFVASKEKTTAGSASEG